MPFKLVPKEQEAELRAKKDNFKIRRTLIQGIDVTYSPDCWTEGIAVVIIDTKTEEVLAYWASDRLGGCWSFIENMQAISPYLFKRPKAAFRRMEKAGEAVALRPKGQPRREARLAVWRAGEDLNLPKYRKINGVQLPGSPRR